MERTDGRTDGVIAMARPMPSRVAWCRGPHPSSSRLRMLLSLSHTRPGRPWAGPYRSRPACGHLPVDQPTVAIDHRLARPSSPPRPISIYNSPGGRREAVPSRTASVSTGRTGKRRRVFGADKVSECFCYLLPCGAGHRPTVRRAGQGDSTRATPCRAAPTKIKISRHGDPSPSVRPSPDYLHYSTLFVRMVHDADTTIRTN